MSLGRLLRFALLAATGVSAGYQVGAYLATRRFFRSRSRPQEGAPSISILKPIRGADVEAAANFRSFCSQDYPDYEVIFGAVDADDPGLAVAQSVLDEAGSAPGICVASAVRYGANLKVGNLLNMLPYARHDLLVITDSDMRVGPDYLRAVAAPFADTRVGIVTCPYRGSRVEGPASSFEALAIATEFIPSVMVAERLGGMRFAFGATLAMRREALAAIDGLEALADHLADDYELGRRIREAGWDVVLSPYVVETVLGHESMRAMWQRRLRWSRTVRVCRPAGYRGSVVTYTTALALLSLVAARNHRERLIPALALLTRILGAMGSARELGAPLTGRLAALLPASDLVSTALWIGGLGGCTVAWRGTRFRLRRDGRLEPIAPPKSSTK